MFLLYKIDLSAIIKDIEKIKDENIKTQISKKIEKVKENPYFGESKRFAIKDIYVVKVNKQRLLLFYRIDMNVDPPLIIFIKMGPHSVYDDTY